METPVAAATTTEKTTAPVSTATIVWMTIAILGIIIIVGLIIGILLYAYPTQPPVLSITSVASGGLIPISTLQNGYYKFFLPVTGYYLSKI